MIRYRFKWQRVWKAAAICYGSRGGGASFVFHHRVGAHDTQSLIGALSDLVVDWVPAHRSLAMAAWLAASGRG